MPPPSEPRPHDAPDDLPDGTTVADLSDEDVRSRAELFAQMFAWVQSDIEEFVAAG